MYIWRYLSKVVYIFELNQTEGIKFAPDQTMQPDAGLLSVMM